MSLKQTTYSILFGKLLCCPMVLQKIFSMNLTEGRQSHICLIRLKILITKVYFNKGNAPDKMKSKNLSLFFIDTVLIVIYKFR